MAAGGPAAPGIRYRKIYGSGFFFLPHRTGNLFAVKQVVFDTGEDASPVTAVDCLINNPADFYINSVTTQNPVVDSSEQIQQPALLFDRRIISALPSIAPCFWFVVRHGRYFNAETAQMHQNSMHLRNL